MSEPTTLSSVIHRKDSGARLVDFLSTRFKYHSIQEWEKLIYNAQVRVNGSGSSPEYILKTKDVVSYTVVLNEPPVDINIRIIHNEEAFLAACKPGNLPSHADGNFIKNTFIYLLKNILENEGYRGYAKLVHRLDRETSGLMLVAKNIESHRNLVRQFEQGKIEKEYIAVTTGIIKDDSLEVNAAIGRAPESSISIRKAVVHEGMPGSLSARTKFEVIERLAGYTVVRCLPATGRTNQIRVHLAHLGHPLAGDKLYGRSDSEFLEWVRLARTGHFDLLPWMDAPRHMLHASMLTFRHPLTAKRVTFACTMPEDMRFFIEKFRTYKS